MWSAETNFGNHLALPNEQDAGKGDDATMSGSGGVWIVFVFPALETAKVGVNVSQWIQHIVGFNNQSFVVRAHEVSNDRFHRCSVRLLWIVSEPGDLRYREGDIWSSVVG